MNLLLLTVFAAGVEIQATQVEALGWTQDGRSFVISAQGAMSEIENPFIVCDTQTGSCHELDADDLKTWQAKHPMAPLSDARTSRDGKATLDIKPLTGKMSGAWNGKGSDDLPAGSRWSPAVATGAELRVDREGQSWVSVSWSGGIHIVKGYWAPDGRQVAWLVRPSDWQGMDGTQTWQLVTGPGGFPRVHVVADKALVATAGAKVKVLLDTKGFATTYVGKAIKARDASVVYFAPGREELAKKAAALIPGGATVDKLTWPVSAELVVALGKKAGAP